MKQILGNSDFLGGKRKFGQSQFLKTFHVFQIIILKRLIFSILTWSRRSNPLTFTRDSGRLPRDEFLVIREGYHMLIFLLLGTVLRWAMSSRELIRINFRLNF